MGANRQSPGMQRGSRATMDAFAVPVLVQHFDILSPRTFRATALGILHGLTLAKVFELRVVNGRVVEEQLPTFALDEPKTFVR